MPSFSLAAFLTSFHVHFPGLGIEDLTVSRQAFTILGFAIYWYGLIMTAAVLLTLFLARKAGPRFGLCGDDVLDTYLMMLPLGIVGARLYYVLFSWEQFKRNWLSIVDLRQGGLAFYGGVIGGALGFYLVSLYKKKRFCNWLDFFVVYLPLGQAIGRWGNFVNQEAFGTNTSLPWGMISEGTVSYLKALQDPSLDPLKPVHPTFLYEFLGNMLIFAILLYVRRQARFHLETTAWYFMLYGTLRFFVESVRTDALFIGHTGLRVSMVLSFLMFICALTYLLWLYFKGKKGEIAQMLLKDWFDSKESAPEIVETVAVEPMAEVETEKDVVLEQKGQGHD